MNAKIEYGLHGAFKVDLYGRNGYVSTTDWFDNFITPTGLMMPLQYSFADCFRYLSIGRSSMAHSGSTGLNPAEVGTTGLYDRIETYTCSDSSTQVGQYINWRGYQTGSDASNCGTILTETGPRFFRAWQIPTGATDIFMNEPAGNGLTISEFMVSPSSGEDLGIGKYAFSRVVRNLYIPNGFRAVISYQLRIDIANTGITKFGRGTFATGNADIENDANIIRTWNHLSGYYKQVYHGLRQVDNLGMTYIPRLGDCMEPSSRAVAKTVWYLSPDNSQFDISPTGGGVQNSVSQAYSSDGVMRPIRQFELNKVAYGSQAVPSNFQSLYTNTNPDLIDTIPTAAETSSMLNIRIGKTETALKVPELGNYKEHEGDDFSYQTSQTLTDQEISYATPGAQGFNTEIADFGKKAVFSTNTVQFPLAIAGQNMISGRKKTVTRRSLFSPVSSLGYNTRFGSLAYAFKYSTASQGNSSYYPYIDCLFLNSSGQHLLPHYRYITGVAFADRGTGIFSVSFSLSGADRSSIFKFNMRSGFCGASTSPSHTLLTSTQVDDLNADHYAGILGSGLFDTRASGSSNGVSVIGLYNAGGTQMLASSSGWGAAYGLVVNSGFYTFPPDLGLYDHNTGQLFVTDTGQLYWPNTANGNEINFVMSGLRYYDPLMGSGFSDTGWFGRNQIIKQILFESVDINNGYAVNSNTNFIKNITGARITAPTYYYGYYLTNKPLSGTPLNITADIISDSAATISGYIISRSTALNNGYLKGIYWTDGNNIPTQSMRFAPSFITAALGAATQARYINRLFTGFDDRGYPSATGGNPFRDGDELNVFFSGNYGGSPVYLTYVSGINTSNLSGQSYLSGTVSLTNFAPPIIRPLHAENFGTTGFRLATNFAPANYYGADSYTASEGGEYPALSFDNGLEMYLDISYSSKCGPNVLAGSCLDPQ